MLTSEIARTARLRLRRLRVRDAPFMLQQLNQPGWLEYIGDRGVHDEGEARAYIGERIVSQYDRYGYGMYAVERRQAGDLIGMAGLVKREFLPEPDLGFALLDRHAGQGYATEAAAAVLEHARTLGLTRVLAITVPHNLRSIALLGRLGFVRDGAVEAPGGEALQRYAKALA